MNLSHFTQAARLILPTPWSSSTRPPWGVKIPSASAYLCDVGHEVVGDTLGVLADGAGLVRADGVEVAQKDNVPLLVGDVQVAQDLLNEELGAAVRVGARQRVVLVKRKVLQMCGRKTCGQCEAFVFLRALGRASNLVAIKTSKTQGSVRVCSARACRIVPSIPEGDHRQWRRKRR